MGKQLQSIAISQTPYRICLAGATDLTPYVKRFGGHGLSGTIDKYVTIVARRRFDDKIRFHYVLGTEEATSREEISNPYLRAAIYHTETEGGLDIASFTDVPFASGLGSSGAFIVGLLNVLWAIQGTRKNARDLAEAASYIEINVLQRPIGKHDQYLAAFGGICILHFLRNGQVRVQKLKLPNRDLQKFEKQFLLVHSGRTRPASRVLSPVFRRLTTGDRSTILGMHKFRTTGERMIEVLSQVDFATFASELNRLWDLQKRVFGSSNQHLDTLIEAGKNAGAISALASGAGGGGFLFFICPNIKLKKRVQQALKHLKAIVYPFSFTEEGTKIIFLA